LMEQQETTSNIFARFVVIWTFTTRFPMPKVLWPKKTVPGDKALALMPLVGGILGLFAGAVAAAAQFAGLPQLAAAWLGVTAYTLGGWALHLDGWGDLWDGLGSGKSGEDMRSVIKDTHLGAFGAVGIVCALGLWTSLLAPINIVQKIIACSTAASLGRLTICSAAFFGVYPWEKGLAKGWVDGFTFGDLVLSLICTLPFAFFAPARWIAATPLVIITGALLALWMNKRLGGTNGDVLGAAAVAGEILALAVFSL
jgi:adenosylcobinamide-GDP ribazoletransferase